MLLQVEDIHSYYDKSHILHGVSMNIEAGELVCLLGRNGVGKSTTLKSIMGVVEPRSGSVSFNGKQIAGLPPFAIARLGLGFVPEERRVFKSLTVHENLQIGIKKGIGSGPQWTLDKIYEAFPRLKERQKNKGAHLSGGEQADAHGRSHPDGEPGTDPD